MQRRMLKRPECGQLEKTYPRVLMKPLVDPSAYREQMSPMCKKLDILSDMFAPIREHLERMKREDNNFFKK